MKTTTMKNLFRNLGILMFGSLPVALIGVWLIAVLFPPEWMADDSGSGGSGPIASFLFHYLALAIPVMLGGALHQLLMAAVPVHWSRTSKRIVILITSPIVCSFLLLTAGSPRLLLGWRALIPLGAALILYGTMARLPRDPQVRTNEPAANLS